MTNVIKQGYLKKVNQSSRLSSILNVIEGQRWFVFVIRNGVPLLEYYDNEDSVFKENPINTFSLQTCKAVQFTLGRLNTDFSFCVVLSDRYLEFTASTRDQMLAWTNTIERSLIRLGILQTAKNDHVYSDFPVAYKPRRTEETDETDDTNQNNETEIKNIPHTEVTGSANREDPAGDTDDDIFGEIGTYRRPSKPRVSVTGLFDSSKPLATSAPDTSAEDLNDEFWIRNRKSSEKGVNDVSKELASRSNIPEEINDLDDGNYEFLVQFSKLKKDKDSENQKDSMACNDCSGVTSQNNSAENTFKDKGQDIDEKFSQKFLVNVDSTPQANNNLEEYESIFSLGASSEKKKLDSSSADNLVPDLVPPPRISPNVKRKSNVTVVEVPSRASGSEDVYSLENIQNFEREKLSRSSKINSSPNYDAPRFVQNAGNVFQRDSDKINENGKLNSASKLERAFSDPVDIGDLGEIPPPVPTRRAVRPNTMGPSEFTDDQFRTLYAKSKETESAPPIKRKNSSVLGQRQQLDTKSGTYSVVSLKQSQVELLKQEILSKVGIEKILSAAVVFSGLALVDCSGAVWIAGWNKKRYPRLYDVFHIGDQLISINTIQVSSAAIAYDLWKRMAVEEKTIVLKRLPHAEVFAMKRSAEGQSLGIRRDGGTAEIIYVDPNGLAARHGLTSKAINMSGCGSCTWSLTEINSRPLNLYFKNNEIEHRLSAVGLDISFVVQPSDFIAEMKKQLKKIKNYKDYLPC